MKIITISQRKGGVGKSSSTLNLACAFAEAGHRVLVADMDDQQNASMSIAGHLNCTHTIEDLIMKNELPVEKVIVKSEWDNVWMLPSSDNLSGVIKYLNSEVGGQHLLRERLKEIQDIDYILIDTGPSLNVLVISALCACDYLFIPLSSQYFCLQGLVQTLGAFSKAKSRLNKELQLLGMAFVIHDKRNTLANEIVAEVRKSYPDLLFKTQIGKNIKIEEAQVKKQSIFTYANKDRGALQYRELGREMLDRMAVKEVLYG
jgi:chromosome partitioning protein